MPLGQILALALSVSDFITRSFFSRISINKMKFISFSAGISIAYIFLVLLPEVYVTAAATNKLLFLPVIIGFSVYHIVEKLIRQRYKGDKLRKEHYLIHSAVSAAYMFIAGFVIAKITEVNALDGFLLFIPVLLHTIIDSMPKHLTRRHPFRVLTASAAAIGAMVAAVIDVGGTGNVILLGTIAGVLLYMVIREALPKERKGNVAYFIIGLALFSAVIMMHDAVHLL